MDLLKKIISLLLAVAIIIYPFNNVLAYELEKDQNQVTNFGGSASGDGVSISKTIEESNLENYFDITLKVKTQELADEQDLAVIIVMDISNTMTYEYGDSGISRFKAAQDYGKYFIKSFYEFSKNSSAKREIGYVTFNRSSYEVFGLQECKTSSQNSNLQSLVSKIKPDSRKAYAWTNMEAGLSRANDMLASSNAKNKYIIFLTDGLPTTYSTKTGGYEGYNPYSSETNNRFYNHEKNVAVIGTNYSDKGAIRAENMAKKMKKLGITIYTVGISIKNQYSLWHLQYNGYDYTVDTKKEEQNFKSYGRYYAVLPGVPKSSKDAKASGELKKYYDDTSYYGTWLKDYIGSNQYFTSDNPDELKKAYDTILHDLKKTSEASWVADDPMNVNPQIKNIEFVGIYNDDKSLLSDSVTTGENNSSNTAVFKNDSINWNLKKSNPVATREYESNGKNIKEYTYELKYRIKLKNENKDFDSSLEYATNGATTLSYVVKETNKELELKKLTFPVPSVVGYFGSLTFNKISGFDNKPLDDVVFRLKHDDNCPCLNEKKHIDSNYYLESKSVNGTVLFDKIPSGHLYKLSEVKTNNDYILMNDEYDVVISYGKVSSDIQGKTIINNIKTRNLTIQKIVKGVQSNKDFDFEITASYNGEKLNGKYEVEIEKNNKVTNEEIVFENGIAKIKLKHNEKIIIKNLPYNLNYSVKELSTDGFIVQYRINNESLQEFNDKNIKSYNLTDDVMFTFINSSGYILPATGSTGMLFLIITGSLLVSAPVIYILINVFKKADKKH